MGEHGIELIIVLVLLISGLFLTEWICGFSKKILGNNIQSAVISFVIMDSYVFNK